MWGRGWNRANLGIVLAWAKSSNNRDLGCCSSLGRTHGRIALGSGSGGGKSRHGNSGNGGGKSRHGCGGGSGGYNNGGDKRARVVTGSRGRRRLPHSGSEAVSSARFHHG